MKQYKIQYVDINLPIFSDFNPRTNTDKQASELSTSIERFDLLEPIILNSSPNRLNRIISGHFRLREARKLGYKKVPAIFVNIPNIKREKELNLRMNANVGEWDMEKLFKEFDVDMMLNIGMDEELFKYWDENLSVESDNFNTEEEIAKIKTPKTKLGDLIILGNHKLICTDSQDPDAIAKLIGNNRISMFNFDPIYNISLDYNNGFGNKGKYGGKVKDKKSDDEYKQFLKSIFQNGLKYALPDIHFFCWCDEVYIGLIQSLYTELGITNRRVCLWIKNNQNPTPQIAFNKAMEPCIYGTIGSPYLSPSVKNLNEVLNKEISTGNRLPDDIMDLFNIWLVKRLSGQNYTHPTEKPPQLYEKALRRCSKPGDIILDLFAGSGALMSGAEQLKRRVFMSEIDPIFCDLIVKRYTLLTGKEAIYVNSEK